MPNDEIPQPLRGANHGRKALDENSVFELMNSIRTGQYRHHVQWYLEAMSRIARWFREDRVADHHHWVSEHFMPAVSRPFRIVGGRELNVEINRADDLGYLLWI